MTDVHLLGVAKVRRSLIVPIVVYTVVNAGIQIRGLDGLWKLLLFVLFDILLWIGVAFLIFAVIERRQKLPKQP